MRFFMFPYYNMKKTHFKKKKRMTDSEKSKYECKFCDFITCNKSDYNRHLKTKKHEKLKMRGNAFPSENKKTQKTHFRKNDFCVCGRRFKTRSGVWKHKKNCEIWKIYELENVSKNVSNVSKKRINVSKIEKAEIEEKEDPIDSGIKSINKNYKFSLEELQIQKAQLEVEKLKKEIENLDKPETQTTLTSELIETIGKIAGNNNCNNTNNISINMYLNENCKNAMNLEDFVKQITVSLQDLDYSKQNGYAKGITNIFLKQLQDLEPSERPIHCSDKKRLKFYVKDDDKWGTDKNNVKITNTIKNISKEQVKALNEWEELNPGFEEDKALLYEWQNMIENITGGDNSQEMTKNLNKIKKEVGKVVDISLELKK